METGGGSGSAAAKGPKDSEVLAAHKDKDKGKGKGKGSKLDQMCVEMAKLLLSHDESINQLEQMALKTWVLPKQSVVMAAGKLEGQK